MLDVQHNVRRFVSEFDNDSDELVADHELRDFDLPTFQREFGVSSDNPMFDCYPIRREQVGFVSMYLEQPVSWDFDNRSYFVEASAV